MGLYLGKEKISNVASVITQNADSMATEIQNHIANSDIHITTDERTKWNTVTEMQNHITDNDIHITADERIKWNAAADKSTEGSTEASLPVNVEILETICENIEFTKTNNTYTFPAAITIDSDGLYYISYSNYTDDALVWGDSGYLFLKPETIDGVLSVRGLSPEANNSITMTAAKIVDTWVASGKSIVSIYKVNVTVNDQLKKAALLQEGNGNIASGNYAHAEGRINTASGLFSHAEGRLNTASGQAAHAEGHNNTASGNYSHAEGYRNEASGYATHVQGKYNVIQSVTGPNYRGKYCHIVGNGTSDTARSNAHTLDWNGNAWFAGDVYTGGTAMDSGAKKLATEVPVSTADNGKVLSVVNGAWAAAAISSGAYTGSYTGNGSSSKTFTFNFKPAVFIIGGNTNDFSHAIGIYGFGYLMNDSKLSTVSWTNNSFTINYQYSAYNSNNVTYYYIVIPAMN